jgi:hypothetical protein
MAVRIQFRRGTESEWASANPVLAQGELGYESTNKLIKFGDGSTQWSSLAVAAAGDITKVKAGTGLRYGSTTTNYGTPDAGDSGAVELEIDPNVVLQASVMNAKGDLIVGTGSDSYAIVGVGTVDGQALLVDSASSSGVAWGTITNPTITTGYISNDMLASNSVTEAKISNGSVTVDKIGSGAVTNAKLATSAVATANIVDANVTALKLASNSVETAKINNLAVTTDKIANNAVTAAKVNSEVYQRGGAGFTATSAKIYIQSTTPTSPAAGDIWFKY